MKVISFREAVEYKKSYPEHHVLSRDSGFNFEIYIDDKGRIWMANFINIVFMPVRIEDVNSTYCVEEEWPQGEESNKPLAITRFSRDMVEFAEAECSKMFYRKIGRKHEERA